jgi:DNA mismatch repair protein MutL
VLHGVPAEVLAGQELETLEKIVNDFKQDEQELKHDRKEKMAMAMGKINAIKSGKTLTEKECRSLLDQLFASQNPYYTPEGNPTFITYNLRDLEKEFEKK